MNYRIISIRENPDFAEEGIDYFASKWGIDRKEYEKSIYDCIHTDMSLPRWYLMLDSDDKIIGSFGLIQNDFVDRTDLFPYLCALYIEEHVRGMALGSRLLSHGREEAAKLGFDKLYLCTDHIGYYEKYGWQYIGNGNSTWGGTPRIYGAGTKWDKSCIEQMSDFFAARAEGYDEHMLNDVEGCKEGYVKMAELMPESMDTLLDLGCGTGLELDEIFKTKPDLKVTGIDLTQSMLEKLKGKHPDKDITLINASYFDYNFGSEKYDAAISFQTMHHFSHEDKIKLYKRIFRTVKTGGRYIECDYMVTKQKDEDFFYNENARLRELQNIPDGEFYHYDTPCTIDNQIDMLKAAGFAKVELVWRMGNTTMIVSEKE